MFIVSLFSLALILRGLVGFYGLEEFIRKKYKFVMHKTIFL